MLPHSPRSIAPHLAMSTLIAGALLAWGAGASAQMTIDDLSITSGPAYRAGVLQTYFLNPFVEGSGIAAVQVTSSAGSPAPLLDVALFEVEEDEFVCVEEIPSRPCEGFASLAEISALGSLTFAIGGELGELEFVTVSLADYDPGAGQSGFPGAVAPSHLETGVSTSATIEWTTPPSWVQVIEVGLEELGTGFSGDSTTFFGMPLGAPVAATTWMPTGLSDGVAYDLELSYLEILVFPEDRTTSPSGLDFQFIGAYEAFNEIVFTVPEPGLVPSLAAGLTMLVATIRRRRPGTSQAT